MSDTPETDAEVNELKSATTYNMVWAEFARKLERERDELRRWTSVNGVSQLAQERDELRAQLREEQQLHVQTLNERDEAREETIRTREFMGRGFAKAKEELATMETRHAAPNMLAALERIVNAFDAGRNVEGHCICDARAAIELAHGNFSYANTLLDRP